MLLDVNPAWVLAAANVLPLAGVVLAGWRVADIVLLYWLENVVIGLANVVRMVAARDDAPGRRLFSAAFFIVHYGGFAVAHGVLLAALFGEGKDLPALLASMARAPAIVVAALGLAASHAWSLARHYFLGRECETAKIDDLMTRPYARVGLLHVFIIAGAFVLQATGSPAAGLALLVAIKTVLDLELHRRSHAALQASSSG